MGDIKKIKKDLKWLPKINIENGVKNLLKNIDYWKQAPVCTPAKIKKATKIWFQLLKIKIKSSERKFLIYQIYSKKFLN